MTAARAFTLRDAVPQDAGDIARLVQALAAYERLSSEAVGTEADFRLQLFGPQPRAHAIVAERGGRIVGMALWFYNFSTFLCRPGLYLEDLFVEPEHRALGIGRALFRCLARKAIEAGCSRMEWSVLDWNADAIRFYQAIGAVGMDDWTIQRLRADDLAALAQEA